MFRKEKEILRKQSFNNELVRAMYEVQLKDRDRVKALMLMLSLTETIDMLATANSVHWYGCVLMMEDGLVLRKGLCFMIKGRKGG